MIMFLALNVRYFIGYYDVPGFSLSAGVGLDALIGNLIGADFSYYLVDLPASSGFLGQILGAVVEMIFRLCDADSVMNASLGQTLQCSILSTATTSVAIVVPMKLYMAMAKRLNHRVSRGISLMIHYFWDCYYVLLIVWLGLLSSGCLSRRVLILTNDFPDIVKTILYFVLLAIISVVFAIADHRFRLDSKDLLGTLLNVVSQFLYTILITAETLIICTSIVMLNFMNQYQFTDEYLLVAGCLTVAFVALIVTAYFANRKTS